MKARSILVDDSFLNALLAVDHPAHQSAKVLYANLVDRYEAGLVRLFAISDVVNRLPQNVRRNTLAPVETLWVAAQHRRAARAIEGAVAPEKALALVMLQRERIRTVASATHDFDDLDLVVLFASPDAEAEADVHLGGTSAVELNHCPLG